MSTVLQFPGGLPHDGHFVRFYDDPDFLLREVVEFVAAACRSRGTGVIIATREHELLIRRGLGEAGVDLRTAAATGRLITVDARETLERILVEGWPDEERFEQEVGGAMASAARRGQPVHAFGEMVSLLCEDGRHRAAIRLEELWNGLARRYRFSLFCAYEARLFANAEQSSAFQQVCTLHTHVCRSERLAGATDPRDAERLLASWQQKATALDHEVLRRQRIERALQRRETDFEDFAENAAEGLHRMDGDGTIVWCNRAELAMLGYARDDYVGRPAAEFHADPDVIEDILRRLRAGETLYDRPARLRCKDGSIKHVLLHSNGHFEDGRLVYARCFTRDATDRIARQAAEEERNTVLANAPVAAALLTGPGHTFRIANERYCEMVGRADLVGRTHAQAFPGLASTELPTLLDRAYRSGETCQIDECRVPVRAADGPVEHRYFKFNLQPVRGAARDEVQGIIAVAVDVTEQVRARRELEHTAAERERLLARLEEASRAKDEFLAMLGHELRNPLAPIVTALQLMRMRGATGTQHEQGIIQRQVDHLVRLVDDLLDVSKIMRGKVELKRERVDVSEVLTRAVEMASVLLEQRSHRLTVDAQAGLQWEGDAVRLAQVVANLLTNAARYTEVGGDIRVGARRHAADGGIVICVADNGAGIAPEVLPHIFALFFQGKRSVERAEGGLGIGLALVKSLVEMHGGRVFAASAGLGLGSEFTIHLPVANGAAQDAATGLPPTAAPGGTAARRVLVVDDNVDAAETLGLLLQSSGHEVKVLHDPVSALQQVEQFAPDVAVLDIGLPVMDGYELAAQLRARLGARSCRLIALTGYGQDGDRSRSRKVGFDLHLVKPVAPAALIEAVDRSVAERGTDAGAGLAGCSARLCGDAQ